MAYQPCRCSVTLLCPVCISVFCTPLALSVLLPFMLSMPISLQCTIPLLCISTPALCLLAHPLNSPPQRQPYLFFVQHSYSLCCLCACNIHNASACSLHAKFLHISSALPHHHRDSSTSSIVFPTRSASLGVLSRFLSFSGS
jgi:hypothetical protein